MSATTTTVLCYHRVAEVANDPFELAVTPQEFSRHLDVLARTTDVVPLAHAGRRPGVAVTFDDGYADNVVAAEILADRDMAATFFVTVGRLGSEEFWWDRLSGALLDEPTITRHLTIAVGGRSFVADVRTAVARRRAHDALHPRLKTLPVEQADSIVEEIERQLATPRRRQGTLTHDEVRSLDADPLFEVGAHTVHHPLLATQPVDHQRAEIAGSQRALTEILGHAVESFAYPFGGRDALTDETVALVVDAGFIRACTTWPGNVDEGSDVHRLPRRVVGAWTAERLAGQLQAWGSP